MTDVPKTTETMDLIQAIDILCRVHLREDPDFGYVVEMGATPRPFEGHDRYAEAWGALFNFRREENTQALYNEARDNVFAK